MNVDECCQVCAEPLEWTGMGVCGHLDSCSKCVARWRFVLKDKSCMMCKQEQPGIYFTRFMGDYTPRLSSSAFAELEARANRGELYHLPDISGFFDDPQHFQLIKSLCGYTHPYISAKCKEAGKEVPVFTSINGMKKYVDMHYKMNFCDICLTSRKVFVCEQLLYNKADLDKHMRSGDETGPLAETSFKGHPLCKFCRKRFYDSNELYKHMESDHEHCFLCRRATPDQYVYYRHYEELEAHFNVDHHPCPHPECLEKKFVVFLQEHELKRHFASEHGDELKMSRAQRREAMTIPINLQYREPGAGGSGHAMNDHDRPGVTIGGGGQFPSRHGRNNQSGRQQGGQDSSSGQGGYGGYGAEPTPSSISFSVEDFPQAAGMASGTGQMTGRWGGYIPGVDANGQAGGSGAGPSRGSHNDHFPALPTMTKAAKKKLRAQQGAGGGSTSGSLADQLRAVNMPVRVVNRAITAGQGARGAPPVPPAPRPVVPEPDPPAAPAAAAAAAAAVPAAASGAGAVTGPAERFIYNALGLRNPAAPPRVSSPVLPPTPPPAPAVAVPEPVPEPSAPVFRPAHLTVAAITASSSTGNLLAAAAAASPARSSRPVPITSSEDFPSLPAAAPAPVRAVPTVAAARFANAANSRSTPSLSSFQTSSVPAAPSAPPPQLQGADFPSLPLAAPAAKRPGSTKGIRAKATPTNPPPPKSQWGQQPTISSTSSATTPTPAPTHAPTSPPSSSGASSSNGASSGAAAPSGTTVSKSLQQANRQLIAKIQSQLSDDARFSVFKQQSGAFLRGGLSAPQYHEHVIQLGLMALVPELAALCPAAERRDALLVAHRAFLATAAAQQPELVGVGWVPPEAAMAATEQVERNASWACNQCTLTNAPDVLSCEACGANRPGYTPSSSSTSKDAFPSLSSVYTPSRGSAAATSGAGRDATGPAGALAGTAPAADASGAADGASGKKKGKGGTKITIGLGAGTARPASSGAGTSGGRGAWAGSGGSKVSKLHGALNDAWGE